ncbi:MAG: hypothetical protein ACTHN5_11180 [Phycisphaerae bacterium]
MAMGQDDPGAATRPAVDLSTPTATLAGYLHAMEKIDVAGMQRLVVVSPSYRQDYANVVMNYEAWMHYLERAAIATFGREPGMAVEGHVRPLDEQIALDLDRLKQANVEYNEPRTEAKVFLPVEKDRPAGLQTDRFNFVDLFYLKKTEEGWKLDYLRTYGSSDPSQNQQYHYERRVFPPMATAAKELSKQLKKGEFKTAEALKGALDAKWKALNEELEKEAASQP